MANPAKSVPENVPGDFFVDSTCIDCDTCRQLAPATFAGAADHSFVQVQPTTPEHRRRALHALVSCPTGSIGCQGEDRPASVFADFPRLVEEPVFYCGFTSPKSYGGSSYFLRHPDGNWLIDSPKFLPMLVRQFEALGGVATIFLTHSDDVADAFRYAATFGARRIIHRAELHAQPDAEVVLDGEEPVSMGEDFLIVPTPGHTAGHCVLLFRQCFLFTGDHLAWDRQEGRLTAFRDYCWFSWPRQIESMRRLIPLSFEWVLPGHGQCVRLPKARMAQEVEELVVRMKEVRANSRTV
jgi:glyoxylase-like metal-dependent hydrolase (beta-lactamase superfamily II)/ferredoxin